MAITSKPHRGLSYGQWPRFRVGPIHGQAGWPGQHLCIFKSLIPKKRDQRGRGLTFTKNRWTHSHTCCFSHTRTMPLQSKHNICSSQKTHRCQKHVQNKIAWRHPSKKEIKEKKDMHKAKQESLYFHLIFCFFCGLFRYFPLSTALNSKPFFTVGDTITWTLKVVNCHNVMLIKRERRNTIRILRIPSNNWGTSVSPEFPEQPRLPQIWF